MQIKYNTNKLTIQYVLPISWTNNKSLKITHKKENNKIFLTNLTEIMNKGLTKDKIYQIFT